MRRSRAESAAHQPLSSPSASPRSRTGIITPGLVGPQNVAVGSCGPHAGAAAGAVSLLSYDAAVECLAGACPAAAAAAATDLSGGGAGRSACVAAQEMALDVGDTDMPSSAALANAGTAEALPLPTAATSAAAAATAAAASVALLRAAIASEGLSGRALRKLPLQAHAQSVRSTLRVSPEAFCLALLRAVEAERGARAALQVGGAHVPAPARPAGT